MMKHFAVIFLLLAFFSSCGTFKATAPARYTETPKLVMKPSVIGVPVEIDMKDLEVKINKELVGLIYEDNSFENNNNDNLKVSAWKRDNFRIEIAGNELKYHIPIKLTIQIKKFIPLPVITAEIALDFTTALALNKDWTLNTKTTSTGYQWISSPFVTIGGYDISIQYIADIILSASKGTIGNEVDKAIRDNLKIKNMMQPVWHDLQKPVKVNDEFNAWLRISPLEVSCTQISGKNNKLNFSAGIVSVNEIFIGRQPDTLVSTKLPDLKLLNAINNNFNLFVNTDLDYTKITEIAKKEMTGQVYQFGKKKIVIDDLTVYGSGSRVAVELLLSGDLNGKIYLMARPFYDAENQSIGVKEVDFDINTRNSLVKSANWLLNGTLAGMIEKKVVYPVADLLESSKKMISDNIRDNRSVKGIVLRGSIARLDIDAIYPGNESLKVVLLLEGKLGLYIQGLSNL
jgi:hypothetical protein